MHQNASRTPVWERRGAHLRRGRPDQVSPTGQRLCLSHKGKLFCRFYFFVPCLSYLMSRFFIIFLSRTNFLWQEACKNYASSMFADVFDGEIVLKFCKICVLTFFFHQWDPWVTIYLQSKQNSSVFFLKIFIFTLKYFNCT